MRKYFLVVVMIFSVMSCKNEINKTTNGFKALIEKDSVYTQVTALSPTIIKVSSAKNEEALQVPSLIVNEDLGLTFNFTIKKKGKTILLSTDSVSLSLNTENGNIVFLDKKGKSILHESGKAFSPESNQATQGFSWQENEVLYGLGQHELADINLRGKKIELVQLNTKVSVPVILSTLGYGIYWDNYSRTTFNDSTDNPHITSAEGDRIQYYFVKGQKFDNIISDFRKLTGEAPMVPKWVLGYVQSRNRYKTHDELMGVVKKQRALNIPMDAIILDYLHWGDNGFGSMVFDPKIFPNPEGMVKELNEKYNCKIIVSVWPTFSPGIPNWKLFNDKNFMLDVDLWHLGQVYDAFNPNAGKLYYDLVKKAYIDRGFNGLWFDATEPERLEQFEVSKCYLGPTAKYLNLYSYFDMKHFFENHIGNSKDRVVILTRSAFMGQQKFGTIVWSGDIGTDFKTLKEQIPTGLNFCMTGIPYWNTDIGGYLGGDPKDPAYQEVFVRWFQYGSFTPFFRAHGRRHPFESKSGKNEMWSYGKENQKILTKYIELRYQLLPYIYTLAHKVSTEGYTMMRALAFDFLQDKNVHEINDQFMFGESIMVCPVTDSGATSRNVYLPAGSDWFNFWTGEKLAGGQTITANAPIDIIPLFVKSGSILPMGSVMQYSSEKNNDSLELRIFGDQDASFTLYEDEGENYNYTKGNFSKIRFNYSAKEKTLTIGKREGTFNGMLETRTFKVIKLKGESVKITYTGTEVNVTLN